MARSYKNVGTQWIVYKTAYVQINLSLYLIEHFYLKGRQWCHWNFYLTWAFRPHNGRGFRVSNRSKCQGYFLGAKGSRCGSLTNLPPSCAECLEIWEPQPPGTIRALTGIALPFPWKEGISEGITPGTIRARTGIALPFAWKEGISEGITPYILSLWVDAGQLYVTVAVFLSYSSGIPWRGGRLGTRGCLDGVEKISSSYLAGNQWPGISENTLSICHRVWPCNLNSVQ
jgi:hypothetical protein